MQATRRGSKAATGPRAGDSAAVSPGPTLESPGTEPSSPVDAKAGPVPHVSIAPLPSARGRTSIPSVQESTCSSSSHVARALACAIRHTPMRRWSLCTLSRCKVVHVWHAWGNCMQSAAMWGAPSATAADRQVRHQQPRRGPPTMPLAMRHVCDPHKRASIGHAPQAESA